MSKPKDPFRYFNSSPEVIRMAVMLYIRYPLSLRNVEDLLFERGIDICHETVRLWRNRFGPMFAAEIRKRRVDRMGIKPSSSFSQVVNEETVRRVGLTRTEAGIVAEQGRAIGTEDRGRRAHIKIDMRVVLGCRSANALERLDPDSDLRDALVVLEFHIVVTRHRMWPTRSR